jgi:polysaccharide export outer membrane protein
LRPGETVEIRLAGVPAEEIAQFSAQYPIDDSGMVNLPYINLVKIAGIPMSQAQTVIEEKLKSAKIYTHPTITVSMQATQRFVNVGGSVRAPGRVPYTPDLTLMSTINAAGGFNDFADRKRVRLTRDSKVQVIDTRKISKDPSLDQKVLPGDQIEIPQSLW